MNEPEPHAPSPPSPPSLLVLLVLLGSGLLLVGVFLPAVQVIEVPTTYHAYDSVNGNLLIVLAGVAFGLVWVLHWYRGLWLAGLAGLALLATTAFRIRTSADVTFAPSPWSWSALLLGAGCLLAAAALGERYRPIPDEEPPGEETTSEPYED